MLTSYYNQKPSVKRAPAPAYVPVLSRRIDRFNAPRPELGLGAAYRQPAPRPNMGVLFAFEAMRNVLAWWTSTYQAVGVHGRNGGVVVSSYLRRRPARRVS